MNPTMKFDVDLSEVHRLEVNEPEFAYVGGDAVTIYVLRADGENPPSVYTYIVPTDYYRDATQIKLELT